MAAPVDALSVERIAIIRAIDQRLDQHCAGCITRQTLMEQIEQRKPRDQAIDRYCARRCPIGAELQSLGQQLGASDPLIPDDVIIHRRFSATNQRKVRTR